MRDSGNFIYHVVQLKFVRWRCNISLCLGGYLSLLGLATRPNIFRVCVAGAPVTCWRLYDTAYTERYMGPPARSPHAYTRASVLAHAPFFPDQ